MSSAPGVVIATRDRRESLLASLGRLTALPERPPIVVVDNGSSDGTAAAVRRAHPLVQVLEPGRNLGAGARNLGVRALNTELVAFGDDDSWWAPGALATASRLFDRHPRMGLLAARILVGPDERLDATSALMAAAPIPLDPSLPGPPVVGFVACGAVVRRRAYLEVGGFDSRFGIGGEETVPALDLAAAGWGLAYVDAVVAHHHPVGGHPERSTVEVRNELWSVWLRRPVGRARARTLAGLRHRPGGAVRALARAAWILPRRRRVPARVERAVRAAEAARAG